MSIIDKITIGEPYYGTLTEEEFDKFLDKMKSYQPTPTKPMPLIITRNTHVLVSKSGHVCLCTGLCGTRNCTKEEFKEAFGVDLGEKNDYVTQLGNILPEEFWQKEKDNDLRSNI